MVDYFSSTSQSTAFVSPVPFSRRWGMCDIDCRIAQKRDRWEWSADQVNHLGRTQVGHPHE